jgi:general secretion pathway protein A
MYRKFYGLDHNPFDLTPDGKLLYASDAHREGIAMLRYGVIANKGFLVLTGGVGTGKTTILNSLLGKLNTKALLCVLNNPTLTRHEFYHYLGKKLNLTYAGNKAEFILQLSRLLSTCRRNGEKVLIIIDEAHAFPVKLLEEVRLLSNHAGTRNVFSIFLIGQPELQERLAHPRLLPLSQRIGIRYHLPELTSEDTPQYIAYRLNMAGAANTQLFSEHAIMAIHEASRGNPRLINVICDHALVSGFTKDMNQIDQRVILECLDEIRLPGEKSLRISPILENHETAARLTQKRKKSSRKLLVANSLIVALILVAGLIYVWHYKGWLQLG